MREVKVSELKTLSSLFNMSVNDIISYDENISPKEIILQDKSENEQIKLINQLDEEDKSTILKIIDTMLTHKKFKDFFQQKSGGAVRHKKTTLERSGFNLNLL